MENKNNPTEHPTDVNLEDVSYSDIQTAVVKEHKIKINNEECWTRELNFYKGELQTKKIDWASDWRFCEVKDKRKQIYVLGVCKTTFPVKYPLLLANGNIIKEGDCYL